MQPRDVLRAIRPLNCFMAALATLIGSQIAANDFVFTAPIGFAMATAFLVCGAGQAINDYADFVLDQKKGKRYRGITLENKHELVWLSLFLFVVGNVLAIQIHVTAFAIALGISLVLILYSLGVGKAKWLGNLLVALGTALPLVFGASIEGDYSVVVWLAASAFLANWAREIVKDCEDRLADEGFKVSLPMLLKPSWVERGVILLTVLGVITAFGPIQLNRFGNGWFLVLLTLASLLFAKALVEFHELHYAPAQQWFKGAMVVALVGFWIGVL